MITVIIRVAADVHDAITGYRADVAADSAPDAVPDAARTARPNAATPETRRLARHREIGAIWGSADIGPATWHAYVQLAQPHETAALINDIEGGWPPPKVVVMAAYDELGRPWAERDEAGVVTGSVSVDPEIWRFMGPVQDGEDGEGNPTIRARTAADPWRVPNVVAGYALPDLEATP